MKETSTSRTDLLETTFSFKNRTRIGTWNVRTLHEPSRIAQVCKEFVDYNLLLLGLSEVRWEGSGEMAMENGISFLFSGRNPGEQRLHGVGIMMKKCARKALLSWKPISERIVTARFRTKARKLTCVQCYAPTEPSPLSEKETFYSQLMTTITDIPKGDIVLLLGDLNARVGNDNTNFESTMGKHGLGERNENGDLFVELCTTTNLVIGGTLFPHKRIHKVTWNSPDQKTECQLDHICISRKWRSSLLDVRNKRGADAASDHHLVIGIIRLKLASAPHKAPKLNRQRYNLQNLKSSIISENFAEEIQRTLNQTITNVTTWENIKNSLCTTAENVLGLQTSERKPWISNNTWEIIERRRCIKAKLNIAKTRASRRELARIMFDLNNQVKKEARKDKRKWINNLAQQAQIASEKNDLRSLYAISKRLCSKNLLIRHAMKDAQGNVIANEEEQIDKWHSHFQMLLNPGTEFTRNPLPLNHSDTTNVVNINTSMPTVHEIVSAIKALKTNKAPGPDGVPAELFKVNPKFMSGKLLPLIQNTWSSGKLPPEWGDGLIIKLPKKGNLQDCNNWRGITLLNVINKILCHIIFQRMASAIDNRLRPEQAGFRPRRSCIDHINSLRIIVEQSNEWRSPLYMVFVDFEKAFDRLSHEAIWQCLEHKGVPHKIIDMIKMLYDSPTCQVLHMGHLSSKIAIKSGVRQGCLLSPILFNIVLDVIMELVTREKCGINWGINNCLEDLDYADDICLVAHTYHDMQKKLKRLSEVAALTGLTINIKKTKSMRCNVNNTTKFKILDIDIDDVECFCYLGSIISRDGGNAKDIENRIGKARKAFGILNPIWKSTSISTCTKIRIFNTNVKSVLLYGCETWNTTKCPMNKLQVFVNRCLRYLYKIFWPEVISNANLWARANQIPLEKEIIKRKWRWIGHALRRPNGTISKSALDWNPQGSRRRGRPSNSWRRSTEQEALSSGKSWKQVKSLAPNRVRWNKFVDALCSL